ncbi:hypothetical protein [Pseudomonas syringae]|uniref:hypothetical protein n=1 Tax=Pseudomonas syringae TaxID=317 RepID=UPI001F2088DF|nr:hypothetical protein [Pseudomonas syringae]
MSQTNFLIGRGELLTRDIKGPKRNPNKAVAYTLARARERLIGQAQSAAISLNALPSIACPNDFGVARVVLNPSYIARSYFPTDMLRATGLESIGSRRTRVTPESWTRTIEPHECSTTEIFVAGKRNVLPLKQN